MTRNVSAHIQLPGLPRGAACLSQYFRSRRWAELNRRFPDLADMRVIDLGGYYWNWVSAPVQPKNVVVVNLDTKRFPGEPSWVESVTADACELPAEIFERAFDLVYSNSLLEHVGGYSRRKALADAVHRLAPHHWVQTPARYCPIEPHWLFPGFQFLPAHLRLEAARRWPFSPTYRRSDLEDLTEEVLGIELVSNTEMRHLFPTSDLYMERLVGIPKSVTAVS
jgi:hypothetical protein